MDPLSGSASGCTLTTLHCHWRSLLSLPRAWCWSQHRPGACGFVIKSPPAHVRRTRLARTGATTTWHQQVQATPETVQVVVALPHWTSLSSQDFTQKGEAGRPKGGIPISPTSTTIAKHLVRINSIPRANPRGEAPLCYTPLALQLAPSFKGTMSRDMSMRVLPGVSPERALEWHTLGQELVRASQPATILCLRAPPPLDCALIQSPCCWRPLLTGYVRAHRASRNSTRRGSTGTTPRNGKPRA